MKTILSVQNELIKSISKLQDKKVRIKENKFLAEGFHMVNESSKHNLLELVLSTDSEALKKYKDVTQILVNDQIIKKLSTTVNPQGIIGVVKKPKFAMLDLDKEDLKIVILDGINDPGNLGSIIRTASALGYDAIIASNDTVDVYNEKSLRATQGAIFKIPVIYDDLKGIVMLFKKHNITLFGTTLSSSVYLEKINPPKKFAVAFGNEARGMSNDLIKLMDQNIKIKMANDVESLNVLSASSIILYELKK